MGKQILVETPLVGRHQLRNVALAIAAAEELSKKGFAGITPDRLSAGFAKRIGRDDSRSPANEVAGNCVSTWRTIRREPGPCALPFRSGMKIVR